MKKAPERIWRCRGGSLILGTPLIMGVVNVTPDSFSDGGRWFELDRAIAHACELVKQGADILDIGGESTRPDSTPVTLEEELRRVIPVITQVVRNCARPVSIDTRRVEVARAALEAGAVIINNIVPLRENPSMAQLARESAAGLVVMHMRGTPQTMARLTDYTNVVNEVEAMLAETLRYACSQGIDQDTLVIDPGIGFAKDTAQNMALLASIERMAQLAPVLIGVSRKRFIGEVCSEPVASERLGGSLAAAIWCAMQGAAILRVHDVKATRQALSLLNALRAARDSLPDHRQDNV